LKSELCGKIIHRHKKKDSYCYVNYFPNLQTNAWTRDPEFTKTEVHQTKLKNISCLDPEMAAAKYCCHE